MKADSLSKRLAFLEAMQPKERDFRQTLQWPAYKETLLKHLAGYPQKGLLEDVQSALDDLENRSGTVTDADVFYAIDPLLRKHYEEFAPNPQTAGYFALISRFKAVGLTDEDMADLHKLLRRHQTEDEYRISGKCASCRANIKDSPHSWISRWRDGELETVPYCSNCKGSNQ
jgi:hypothetical protein